MSSLSPLSVRRVPFRVDRHLTQFWCSVEEAGSFSSDQPGLKKIDFATPTRLTFYEFEARDLTLSLSIRPRQSDGGADGPLILCDADGESFTGTLNPRRQPSRCFAPDHHLEFGDDLARFNKSGDASFDGWTVTVSALDRVSLPIVIRRAIVLADGIRCRFCASAFSARGRPPLLWDDPLSDWHAAPTKKAARSSSRTKARAVSSLISGQMIAFDHRVRRKKVMYLLWRQSQ